MYHNHWDRIRYSRDQRIKRYTIVLISQVLLMLQIVKATSVGPQCFRVTRLTSEVRQCTGHALGSTCRPGGATRLEPCGNGLQQSKFHLYEAYSLLTLCLQ